MEKKKGGAGARGVKGKGFQVGPAHAPRNAYLGKGEREVSGSIKPFRDHDQNVLKASIEVVVDVESGNGT